MMLERDNDLEVLASALAGVASSGGKVVLVRGEAGIGKTTLVREFFERHGDGATFLFGFCDDLLTPQPLGPFWDIAREEMSLGEVLENGDRRAVMEAVLDLLSRRLRPTVLVVEDTQWADEATLDVIKYLGRRIAATGGLLVLTYRDGEVDFDHPLRRVIGELAPQNLERIHLDTLSAEAVASMIDTNIELDEVLALTDGNPLFVTEVAASGVEGVPSSVRDAVLARAGKLSLRARSLLDLVSVIPGESERSLMDIIVEPTHEQMAECARQGLLHVGDKTVSFHHELSRRAVESALSAPDRRRLNRQVLTELGEHADPSRLVHHAREAGDVEGIIEFAPRAARAAMATESYREASAQFRALEPYEDRIAAPDRAAIFDDWVRSEFHVDNVESFDILARAIDLHRATGDDRALARALAFAVRVNEINGRPEAAEACVAEAVAILEAYPPSADLAFALSQHAWLFDMRGDHVRATELADQAISVGEESGDELSVIHALNTKGAATYSRGDPVGLSLLDEARRSANRAGYPFEEARALLNMTTVVLEQRELGLASDMFQQTSDTAARHQILAMEMHAQAQYADVLMWKGDWATAEDTATELGETVVLAHMVAGRVLGRLQARQGRPEARTTIDNNWTQWEAAGQQANLVGAAASQAEHMWLTGKKDPARIARFREILDQGVPIGPSWIFGDLAFWLWKLGAVTDAPIGIAEPYRLVMEGKTAEAAAIWEAKGVPYERAVALMHGDQTARLEALKVFVELGATAAEAKLRKALRDDGVVVPRGKGRDTVRHAAGLTARRAEVLQLLDEDLSNSEIAERLFVSPRTIQNHVAAVLEKLHSSTRTEAVSRAHAEGLLTAMDTQTVL